MKDSNSELKERISELELIEDNRREFWSTLWGMVGCLFIAAMIATAFFYIGQEQGQKSFMKEHKDSVCIFIGSEVNCITKEEFNNYYKSKNEVIYEYDSPVPNQKISER